MSSFSRSFRAGALHFTSGEPARAKQNRTSQKLKNNNGNEFDVAFLVRLITIDAGVVSSIQSG